MAVARSSGLLVGDAPALHHARGHAHGLGHLRELRAAAVHHHHLDAEVVQDRDLLDQRARGDRVAEHGAAGLHDEGLALVHADVRGGAAQAADGGGLAGVLHDHGLSLGSSVKRSERAGGAARPSAPACDCRLRARTTLRGPSSRASVTATLRRTGRQCMKWALGSALANQLSSTFQSASRRRSSRIARGIAVVARGAPFLGIEHVRALHGGGAVGGLGERAAGGCGQAPGLVGQRLRDLVAFGAQHHHFHAALGGHGHGGGGHGQRQRARMVDPRQHELAVLGHVELIHASSSRPAPGRDGSSPIPC